MSRERHLRTSNGGNLIPNSDKETSPLEMTMHLVCIRNVMPTKCHTEILKNYSLDFVLINCDFENADMKNFVITVSGNS